MSLSEFLVESTSYALSVCSYRYKFERHKGSIRFARKFGRHNGQGSI